VGTSYQLGNLVSSASSTIESTLGERFPLPPLTSNGKSRYDYGRVICIFMACVYVYVIILTFIGPEHLRRKFDVAHDADVREVAGEETIVAAIHRRERMGMGLSDEDLEDAAEARRQELAAQEKVAATQ
jgi:SHS family lactate transporter-like MFS transporter